MKAFCKRRFFNQKIPPRAVNKKPLFFRFKKNDEIEPDYFEACMGKINQKRFLAYHEK